jgi:hypothetical protein
MQEVFEASSDYSRNTIMSKYRDLKTESDAARFATDTMARKIQREIRSEYHKALNSCHSQVINQLMEIGSTFLGGRFFFKRGYRVEHFKAKDGSWAYLWNLEHQIHNGTSYYYPSLCIKLRYDGQKFVLEVKSSYLEGPNVDKTLGEKVVKRLKNSIEELNKQIA